MPPVKKRDFTVFLVDVGMRRDALERAKGALMEICARKDFSDTGDLMQLVLVNAPRTDNGFSRSGHRGFQHIVVAPERAEVCDPVKVHELLSDVDAGAASPANWLNAVRVATLLLEAEEKTKGVQTYQITYMTDLATPLSVSEAELRHLKGVVVKELARSNVYLYLLGPEIKVSRVLKSFRDVEEVQNEARVDLRGLIEDRGVSCPDNIDVLQEIVGRVKNCIVCGLSLGKELMFCYKKHKGTQPWYVPLSIGNDEDSAAPLKHLPTSMSRLVRHAKLTLNVFSNASVEWKWLYADEDRTECDYDNVIGCVVLQEKFLPMTPELVASFKERTFRSFRLIGFTADKNVPEYLFAGDGSQIIRHDRRQGRKAYRPLQTLSELLSWKKMSVIASRVYANNTRNKLMCLVPRLDFKRNCFLAVELPFADDVRRFASSHYHRSTHGGEDEDLDPQTEEEHREAVYEYLDSMRDDSLLKKGVPVALSPAFSFQISATSLYRQLLKKRLGVQVPFAYEEADLATADVRNVVSCGRFEKIWDSLSVKEEVLPVVQESTGENSTLAKETAEFCF